MAVVAVQEVLWELRVQEVVVVRELHLMEIMVRVQPEALLFQVVEPGPMEPVCLPMEAVLQLLVAAAVVLVQEAQLIELAEVAPQAK
jgi:hypothetical protein